MKSKLEDFTKQVKETISQYGDLDPDNLETLLRLLYWALRAFKAFMDLKSRGELGESGELEPVELGPITVSAGAPRASVSLQVIDADGNVVSS